MNQGPLSISLVWFLSPGAENYLPLNDWTERHPPPQIWNEGTTATSSEHLSSFLPILVPQWIRACILEIEMRRCPNHFLITSGSSTPASCLCELHPLPNRHRRPPHRYFSIVYATLCCCRSKRIASSKVNLLLLSFRSFCTTHPWCSNTVVNRWLECKWWDQCSQTISSIQRDQRRKQTHCSFFFLVVLLSYDYINNRRTS